ncbi:domain found in IF2B/IF5-domain-containing protein [Gorgonomyces haynaldii]|nr:domain found in IF2B/IF5-domain-containing protein [Gorgonomyces haynaldii]
MSGVVNIRRDVDDKFYRYKMPKLIVKVEGRGNGIKTVIVNLVDVAKALSRPPTYPIKYFGTELGAQVKIEQEAQRYILTGQHDAEKLQTTLDGFIDKFVLCGSCKNPETDLVISKEGTLLKDCKACGSKLPADMAHKLVTFVMRDVAELQKKLKKERKQKKEQEQQDDGDDEITRRIESEAALIPEAQGDDDDFLEDTSAEAVAARQKELQVSGAVAKLLEDENDSYEQFYQFVIKNQKGPVKQLIEKAEELDIRPDHACTVLVQALLNENVIQEKQIQKNEKIFKAFLTHPKSMRGILGGIERLVGEHQPQLTPKVALLLKDLYQFDIVSEEACLLWDDKPSKKYLEKSKSKAVHKAAQPFINWLREASEEEDDD